MTEPKRRRRGPTPKRALTGETMLTWQSDMQLVRWAQTDPTFRLVLTVATNERRRVTAVMTATENRMLGRVEGYEECLRVLEALATGTEKPAPEKEVTFTSEETTPFTDVI